MITFSVPSYCTVLFFTFFKESIVFLEKNILNLRFRLHVKKVQHKVKKKKMGKDAIKFTKMQGAGNDYVYIDATSMEKIPANISFVSN